MKKKERTNESCDIRLVTSKEIGKESRQVVMKAGWGQNGTVSTVFVFICLAMYLLNVHWQQQGRERKRKIVRESSFINDTDNFIFQIILNLLPEFFLLQQHMRYFSFIDLFFLDSEIFLIWIIKKIFYIKFSRHYWRVYSSIYICVHICISI